VTRIHVRFTKWDGTLHWHYDVARLGEDDHGVWLGGADGTPVRRGTEPPIASPRFALLVPRNEWWTATFNESVARSPFGYVVYVDMCTPAEWEGETVSSVDLDLDVAMNADGEVFLLDEDEFEEHRLAMRYPDHIADRARVTAAALFTDLEAGREPFASVGASWLGRVPPGGSAGV